MVNKYGLSDPLKLAMLASHASRENQHRTTTTNLMLRAASRMWLIFCCQSKIELLIQIAINNRRSYAIRFVDCCKKTGTLIPLALNERSGNRLEFVRNHRTRTPNIVSQCDSVRRTKRSIRVAVYGVPCININLPRPNERGRSCHQKSNSNKLKEIQK